MAVCVEYNLFNDIYICLQSCSMGGGEGEGEEVGKGERRGRGGGGEGESCANQILDSYVM